MVRWAILLMKLVIGGCVIWKTSDYVLAHYPNYIPGLPFEIEVASSVIAIALSACLFLLALAFINEANILRVLINWAIIAFFTIGAWLFGNLMAGTPQDDFELTENWNLLVVCAMIGALMGYVVCLMREPATEVADDNLEDDELSEDDYNYASERYADIVHD